MPRSLRLTYPGAMQHVTMRCNNKEFLFEPESLRLFIALLYECCDRFRVPLYNYCLMTNHVHLLFKVLDDGVLSDFMQRLANVFAKKFNALKGRKGHLWEERFHSTIVEEGDAFLRCMAYIDLNPLRARMVPSPEQHPWSGHCDLRDENDSLLTMHDLYLRLGKRPTWRYAAYRRLLEQELATEPFSLAFALFFGTPEFTRDLQARFRLTDTNRHRIRRIPLRGGLEAVELVRGGGFKPRHQRPA